MNPIYFFPLFALSILAYGILSWQQEIYDRKIVEFEGWEEGTRLLNNSYRNGWVIAIGLVMIGSAIPLGVLARDTYDKLKRVDTK